MPHGHEQSAQPHVLHVQAEVFALQPHDAALGAQAPSPQEEQQPVERNATAETIPAAKMIRVLVFMPYSLPHFPRPRQSHSFK